jgi:hypothetical protein
MWPIKPMRDPKKFYKHWVWKVNEAWLKSIKMPAQTRLDGSCQLLRNNYGIIATV